MAQELYSIEQIKAAFDAACDGDVREYDGTVLGQITNWHSLYGELNYPDMSHKHIPKDQLGYIIIIGDKINRINVPEFIFTVTGVDEGYIRINDAILNHDPRDFRLIRQ